MSVITTVITTDGITAIIGASSSGPLINVTSFQIGSDIITPTADMTGVTSDSVADSAVYVGNSSQISYQIINNNTVKYVITLDETVGNFEIGNIGLFLNSGTLFSISALPQQELKSANGSDSVGNYRIFNIILTVSNLAIISNFTVEVDSNVSLPVVANETLLPNAGTSSYNAYLVQTLLFRELNMPAIAIVWNNEWWYIQAGDVTADMPYTETETNALILFSGNTSTISGASHTYDLGDKTNLIFRENGGNFMSDTLPGPPGVLAAKTLFIIDNTDTSAFLQISPASGASLDGSSNSIFLGPNQKCNILSDGADYWTLNKPDACFIPYAGNPNGYVAGVASTGLSPPTIVIDTTNGVFWVCTTTGSPSSAVWSIWGVTSLAFDSIFGSTQGSVLYRGPLIWAILPPSGTPGYVLATGGTGENPYWVQRQSHGECQFSYVSAAEVQLLPYNGCNILCGGVQYQIPIAGVTAGINSSRLSSVVVASTTYYVSYNGAAGELNFWSQASYGHAPDTTAGNLGIEVITSGGAPLTAETLVGMVWTDASTQLSAPCTVSWFNRRDLAYGSETQSASSVSSTSMIVLAAGGQIDMVTWSDEAISEQIFGDCSNTVAGASCTTGAGFDAGVDGSEATATAPTAGYSCTTGALSYITGASEGHHILNAYGKVSAGDGSWNFGVKIRWRG